MIIKTLKLESRGSWQDCKRLYPVETCDFSKQFFSHIAHDKSMKDNEKSREFLTIMAERHSCVVEITNI